MRTLKIVSFHLLLTLVCSFDMHCEWQYEEQTFCYPTNLNITSPEQFVSSVSGNTTVPLKDVPVLWIEDQICHYVPHNVSSFMPNLEWLAIVKSGLRTITKFDLGQFRKLTALTSWGNRLEYIDGDVFSLNDELTVINFKDTNLLIINGPILKPVKKLFRVALDLPCLKQRCDVTKHCMPGYILEFSERCVFDSLYPGFTKYLTRMKHIAESCRRRGNCENNTN